jgi:L-xylulokinase
LGGTAKLEAQEKGVSYFKVLDELIGMVPIEKARVFFQPFVAQPSLHNNAKANFFNMDSNTSYAEICYSVAEGVAFIHKHHIDILKSKGLPIKKVRFTGGVARSPIWRQIFANVLEMPIESGECEETGALGVAIAAGIGAGIYSSFDDAFKRAVRLIEPSYPDESKFEIYRARYKEWRKLNDIMYQYWDGK